MLGDGQVKALFGKNLTQEQLKSQLLYDPITGNFTRKVSNNPAYNEFTKDKHGEFYKEA